MCVFSAAWTQSSARDKCTGPGKDMYGHWSGWDPGAQLFQGTTVIIIIRCQPCLVRMQLTQMFLLSRNITVEAKIHLIKSVSVVHQPLSAADYLLKHVWVFAHSPATPTVWFLCRCCVLWFTAAQRSQVQVLCNVNVHVHVKELHTNHLLSAFCYQPISNADFIVPVEIEGTTHQVKCRVLSVFCWEGSVCVCMLMCLQWLLSWAGMGLVTDQPGLHWWMLGALYWPDVGKRKRKKCMNQQEISIHLKFNKQVMQ